MSGSVTGPWLSETDQSNDTLGVQCTRAGDLGANTRTILTLARALQWLSRL